MPISLMYHDVLTSGGPPSGFPGSGAEHYKLLREEFLGQLHAISKAVSGVQFGLVTDTPQLGGPVRRYLTFDDGGVSAYTQVADLLESRGWRGHFFITTDYVGTDGFMDARQIRELSARGHLIGSHSRTHPVRISSCTPSQLLDEWSQSVQMLSDLIGEPVTVGSVPGGFFSRGVAQAAAESGLRFLFTSEPTTRASFFDGCQVLGRFAIYRGTTMATVASLAKGNRTACCRQALSWKLKKAAKVMGGRFYPALRESILSRSTRQPAQAGASPSANSAGNRSLGI